MPDRSHGRSPWRDAYEALMASRGSSSETVTLKVNAKGEFQPEVTAVRQDGETLIEAYGRASRILRIARADFASQPAGNGDAASLLPAEGLTALPTPFDDVDVTGDDGFGI
jgi:hypothetical protein